MTWEPAIVARVATGKAALTVGAWASGGVFALFGENYKIPAFNKTGAIDMDFHPCGEVVADAQEGVEVAGVDGVDLVAVDLGDSGDGEGCDRRGGRGDLDDGGRGGRHLVGSR